MYVFKYSCVYVYVYVYVLTSDVSIHVGRFTTRCNAGLSWWGRREHRPNLERSAYSRPRPQVGWQTTRRGWRLVQSSFWVREWVFTVSLLRAFASFLPHPRFPLSFLIYVFKYKKKCQCVSVFKSVCICICMRVCVLYWNTHTCILSKVIHNCVHIQTHMLIGIQISIHIN
jgi:hypothetical protein